uniref:Uncharacterized protein n=1 Tax=Salvator merianae TaxID=96440 RepID=A0A8D0DRH4_SALMN
MRRISLGQVIPEGLAFILDISPVAHRVIMCHLEGCEEDTPAWYHTFQILFFSVSAYFFSCPVPEKYFPASCNIVGHAHQIFHTFPAICTLSQLEAIFMITRRSRIFSPRGTGLIQSFCPVAPFFGLVACSAGTASHLQCARSRWSWLQKNSERLP